MDTMGGNQNIFFTGARLMQDRYTISSRVFILGMSLSSSTLHACEMTSVSLTYFVAQDRATDHTAHSRNFCGGSDSTLHDGGPDYFGASANFVLIVTSEFRCQRI